MKLEQESVVATDGVQRELADIKQELAALRRSLGPGPGGP